MSKAEQGSKVKIHYTGKLDNDQVFDSSEGKAPMEFTIGEKMIIPGLEEAVTGMGPSDTKTVTISPDKAYGDYREEMIFKVPRNNIPEDIDPKVGQNLQVQQQGGQPSLVTVKEVTDEDVTLDANHPLAGKDLIFDIELVEVA